jgi:hypothetical protein
LTYIVRPEQFSDLGAVLVLSWGVVSGVVLGISGGGKSLLRK